MAKTDHLEKGEVMSEHKTPEKRETPYTTHEVENGLIKNEVGKPLKTVYDYLCGKLREDHCALWERVDYFHSDADTSPARNIPWPREDRIACFAIPGDSEGYYVHVEWLDKGHYKNLLLGKCWTWDDALELSNVLTRMIY